MSTTNQQTLYIVIGCDTDPDRVGFLDNVPSDTLTWRGMLSGIPRLKSAVAHLTDGDEHAPVFTWLLRVDEQIRRVHGEYAWVLRQHRAFLEELESSGDELGWHPHFWRFEESAHRWYQDAIDVQWQIEMLKSAHADYVRVLPGRAKSVRMGWDYHNNSTLAMLAELGVLVDFSAIPGMSTMPQSIPRHPENLFDWSTTPRHVYRPSTSDYRRPVRGSESPLSLLEAPNTVSTSRVWGMISGLQLARKMRDPAQLWSAMRRPTYWINMTGRANLFRPVLSSLRNSIRRSPDRSHLFVSYFHPDELLPNNSSLYNLESAVANIDSLLTLCAEEHVTPRFVRAAAIPSLPL